jgi:hypothetical protein
MQTISLIELKDLAAKQGIKFSNAEYVLLGHIRVLDLPYATPGKKQGSYYFQCDGFRILLKSGANLSALAGKVEICTCVVKDEEYKFLVVS